MHQSRWKSNKVVEKAPQWIKKNGTKAGSKCTKVY
jgi:hypothetical protein